MKKKIFALAVAAMAVLGAQAQTSYCPWDEDFINNINLYFDVYGSPTVKENNTLGGITAELGGWTASSFKDGYLSGNGNSMGGDGVKFTTSAGTFTKIVVTYDKGDITNPSWTKEETGGVKTLTWSGDNSTVWLDHCESSSFSIKVKQIDFTIVGSEYFTISDIPSDWTVNGQKPVNGKVKIGKGSAVVVKPANIPTGKKIKSIKFVKDE